MEWWFVDFTVSDSYTGMNRIIVQPNQQVDRIPRTTGDTVYYR